MKTIHIINGPNLNLLGQREPELYGDVSMEDALDDWRSLFKDRCQITYYQSNIEGELINALQRANADKVSGIVLNAAAYTHTSIAISDTLAAITVPVIEVHISHIYKRESFRQHSYTAPHTLGVLTGFGLEGYRMAIEYLVGLT